MDKKIVQAVLERSKGLCEVCHKQGQELHHILSGNGRRRQHENADSVIMLCSSCHRGTNGVHGKNGAKLDLQLKLKLQETYFKQGKTEGEIRVLMGGRLYGTD